MYDLSLLARDIARMNLLCTEGLPGAEDLDIDERLRKLDRWAAAVGGFVQDGRPGFQRNPGEYNHHEGFFCFLSMVTVLKHPRGLNIRYQPKAVGSYDFSDSRDDFS